MILWHFLDTNTNTIPLGFPWYGDNLSANWEFWSLIKKVYHLIIWSDNQARKAQKIPKLGQLSWWDMILWKASEHGLKWTCPGPSDQGWSIWQRCLSMFLWMFELLWIFSNLIFWEIRSVRQSSHVYKGFQMIEMEKAKRERATPNQGLILFTIILDRDLSIVVFV